MLNFINQLQIDNNAHPIRFDRYGSIRLERVASTRKKNTNFKSKNNSTDEFWCL